MSTICFRLYNRLVTPSPGEHCLTYRAQALSTFFKGGLRDAFKRLQKKHLSSGMVYQMVFNWLLR